MAVLGPLLTARLLHLISESRRTGLSQLQWAAWQSTLSPRPPLTAAPQKGSMGKGQNQTTTPAQAPNASFPASFHSPHRPRDQDSSHQHWLSSPTAQRAGGRKPGCRVQLVPPNLFLEGQGSITNILPTLSRKTEQPHGHRPLKML